MKNFTITKTNVAKLKHYLLGKELIAIDEALRAQNLMPDAQSRKEVAEFLLQWGWSRGGRRRLEGELKSVWERLSNEDSLKLDILRLELLEKRQTTDVRTIEELLEKGFTKEECLLYLQMLYNSNIETLETVAEEEKEAENFAIRVQSAINTMSNANKLMAGCAFMFYIEKYFPGLMTGELYRQNNRMVYAKLFQADGDPEEKMEWFAFIFPPHFLDLTPRIPDKGDLSEFKNYAVKLCLTKKTLDTFFPDGIDYKLLAGFCAIARLIAKSKEPVRPLMMPEEVFQKFTEHITELKNKYG